MLAILFACGVIGFVVGRQAHDRPWLLKQQRAYLTIGLPVLLFACSALGEIDLVRCIANAGLYLLAAGGFLVACTLIAARLRWNVEPTVLGLTATLTNTVMVGIPLFNAVDARDVLALIYFIIPLQALSLFTVATFALRRTDERATRPQLVPNVTYGLVAGVAIGAILPHPPELDGIRTALFAILQVTSFTVLGTSLGCVRVGSSKRSIVGSLVLAKLVLMPAFIYGVFALLRPEDAPAATLIAALPVGINALSYVASIEDRSTSYVSRAILYTTVAAIPSLGIWLRVFGYV